MTIIAVNGKKFTTKVLDAAISEAQTTHKAIVLLVEDGDYYRALSVEYHDGPRFPHLVRIDGRPDCWRLSSRRGSSKPQLQI